MRDIFIPGRGSEISFANLMSRTQAEPGKGVKGLKIEISQVKPYFRAHSLISELCKVRVAVKEFTSALTSLRL